MTKNKLLLRHIDTLTKSNIKIDKLDRPTFCWLSKLHKDPYTSKRDFHTFKSDLINNMDHMRISGTETSSVILSKQK